MRYVDLKNEFIHVSTVIMQSSTSRMMCYYVNKNILIKGDAIGKGCFVRMGCVCGGGVRVESTQT